MKGNILTQGVISADDGNRYNYSDEDFKDDRVAKNGDEVDFILDDGQAKEIYITKQKLTLDVLKLDTDVGKIRLMALASLALYTLGSFRSLFFLQIFAAILIFFAIYKFGQVAKSNTLFKNYVISGVLVAVGNMMILYSFRNSISDIFLRMMKGYEPHVPTGIVIGIIIAIISLYWRYEAYKELSNLSSNKFFIYAFYCYTVGIFTIFFSFAVFITISGYILEAIAWYQLKEIKNQDTPKDLDVT